MCVCASARKHSHKKGRRTFSPFGFDDSDDDFVANNATPRPLRCLPTFRRSDGFGPLRTGIYMHTAHVCDLPGIERACVRSQTNICFDRMHALVRVCVCPFNIVRVQSIIYAHRMPTHTRTQTDLITMIILPVRHRKWLLSLRANTGRPAGRGA